MVTRRRPARIGGGALVAAAGSLAAAAGVVLLARFRPRRVVVEGRSMEPTLAPGDRLLVVRARPVRAGDVVAVRDPLQGGRLLVKRVGAVLGDEVVVRGDNEAASTDSREFGPVPAGAVLGRVVRCYAPPWRAGPVR